MGREGEEGRMGREERRVIAARACQCKTVVSELYQGACWASGNLKVRKPLSSQFIVRVANVIMMYYYTDTSYHPLHRRHLQTSPFLSPDSRTVGCLASGSRPHHWEKGRTCTIETLTRCTAHRAMRARCRLVTHMDSTPLVSTPVQLS